VSAETNLALTAAPIGMLVVEVAAFAALACVLLVTLWRRRVYVERVVTARTETLEREAADRTRATETLRRNEQQQKEVARALRESEERYRMLAEQSSDFIARYRLDGTVVYASPACRTLLGYEPQELLGTSYYELFHQGDVDPVRQRITAAGADPATVSYRVRRKDGATVWLESTLRVVREPATEAATEVVAVSRDISERKRVDRMRQDLVAMLSHDLKNPLTAVLGFAEILREAPADDPQRDDFLARIEANAHSALSLAINFVDASQIESGTLEPRVEPLFVNDIVEHVVRHQESRARVKQIRLEARLDRSRPMALLDRRLIDRIVANLVNNAIKFSPAKSHVLVETVARDGIVVVRVQDHGPGIAPDQRSKLFQRFSEMGDRRIDSTGLGLFIVKTLVDAQGGTVRVDFPPEGGTVFEVVFPASSD
jgi:PAS domain S-box-containing protein